MQNKGELFLKELEDRNIIQNITNKQKVINALNNNKKIYVGFDPSGSSLHLGNYVVINILNLCKKYDIGYVIIIGGITGMIGDPSGKKVERKLLDVTVVQNNINSLKKQINNLLPNSIILNNADFYVNSSIIDFLRNVGKYINISYLLNKEVIKNRLETGISFTEFAYSLIQANDFYVLFHNYDVAIEIGGSDQWGNITIGIDYINKKDNIAENDSIVCGITFKLLLKSDGTKFGKTENGAIYLDENMTSPYTMYQFLLNQQDDDAYTLLSFLTTYSISEINDIIEEAKKNPKARIAQKKLAENIISNIYSKELFDNLVDLSSIIFKSDVKKITINDINLLRNDFPIIYYDFKNDDNISDILIASKIFNSKNEIRYFFRLKCWNVARVVKTLLGSKESDFGGSLIYFLNISVLFTFI